MDVLWILLIGLLAGWIASRVMKVHNLGLGGYLLVGVIGAFLGGYIFIFLDIPIGGLYRHNGELPRWSSCSAVYHPAS